MGDGLGADDAGIGRLAAAAAAMAAAVAAAEGDVALDTAAAAGGRNWVPIGD